MDVFDKFTTKLKSVLIRALQCAEDCRAQEISPIHLLLCLGSEKGSIGSEILARGNYNALHSLPHGHEPSLESGKIQTLSLSGDGNNLPRKKPSSGKVSASLMLGVASKKIIERAILLAEEKKHKYVGTEHLLSALIAHGDVEVVRFFKEQKIHVTAIQKQIDLVMRNAGKLPEITDEFIRTETRDHALATKEHTLHTRRTPAIDAFARDLQDPKILETIDPVIGREKECERIMQTLLRKAKNNPILVGDPGVGKTAIVEGLAKKIAAREVPYQLLDKRIVTLDLGLLVAGTMYRGEFESRLKELIDEARTNPNIILFIDEIHTISGAGSASGSLDAASMLKPALARGEVKIIGATTFADYKKYIEPDAALERRFQPITVHEPGEQETLAILKGLRPSYEKFHRVKIADDALDAAIHLGNRYIEDRHLPDKAIDLLDEAASSVALENKDTTLHDELNSLLKRLTLLGDEKRVAVLEERYEDAVKLRERESALRAELIRLKKKITTTTGASPITTIHIARVISRLKNIPIGTIVREPHEKIIHFEKELARAVIGQEYITKKISDRLTKAYLGLGNDRGPRASFLFLGPSGVGKTLTAENIARIFFGTEDALLKLDMSEFSESFQISKLIGAPAGYVGYRDTNKLTDPIKARPYSLVLFDEVEKAHPEVLNLLLQILEDGYLTDATAKKVSFKNTIIVMTSNVGSDTSSPVSGFGGTANEHSREKIENALRTQFRKEFLSRIDEVLSFNPLTEESIRKITELECALLKTQINEKFGITLNIMDDVQTMIAENVVKEDESARKIKKVLADMVELPLAQYLLHNNTQTPRLTVGLKGGTIVIDADPKADQLRRAHADPRTRDQRVDPR